MKHGKANGALILRYLRERSGFLLAGALGVGVFALTNYLYRLPAEPVWYGTVLCLLMVLAAVPVDFWRYAKDHRQRKTVLQNLPLMLDELPKGQTLAEEELLEIIQALSAQGEQQRTEAYAKNSEAMDYYTTWVHQIKTPISVMKLALDGEDTDQSRQLSIELFRIEQYVEMALQYIRLGGGASDYLFKEQELDAILRQSVRKYAPQFVGRRLRLVYQPTNLKVLTDEKWLAFLVEQLLSNSIKYTPPGGTITITAGEDHLLRIQDNGIGIAAEDLPRVFEKGFTGYNGRADKKATGLGLYLCKQTADRLGHKIGIRSQPGRGTEVWLDLTIRPRVVE